MTELRKLRELFILLKFVDARLPTNKTDKSKLLGGFLLCLYVSFTLAIGMSNIPSVTNVPLFLAYMVYVVLAAAMSLQYVLLVLELWVRFQTLNAVLLQSLQFTVDPELWSLLGGSTTLASLVMLQHSRQRHLRDAYVTLTHAADLLQEHFGLAMAVNIATSVCSVTLSLYELVMTVTKPGWIFQFSLSKSSRGPVMWVLFHSTKLLSVAFSSAAAADAAAATGLILLRTSALSTWRDSQDDSFLRFTLQVPPLRFTAAGFFTVDRPLLVSIVTVIMTYVIILAQLTPK
ncbi:gustatory receptor 68a-like [Schistocerca serialis cubense]|uniref:gustatory receptor 68a-like n=1 Tax=Schistocerca serialis cubense TaxID=2023355 RepID=UPI00214E1385|nr:gustatory receptor 68a-like [Schistocerca serialis cubense]